MNHLKKLERYIKKNGKAKTAVALGLTETTSMNNWLKKDRNIPKRYLPVINDIAKIEVVTRFKA